MIRPLKGLRSALTFIGIGCIFGLNTITDPGHPPVGSYDPVFIYTFAR